MNGLKNKDLGPIWKGNEGKKVTVTASNLLQTNLTVGNKYYFLKKSRKPKFLTLMIIGNLLTFFRSHFSVP